MARRGIIGYLPVDARRHGRVKGIFDALFAKPRTDSARCCEVRWGATRDSPRRGRLAAASGEFPGDAAAHAGEIAQISGKLGNYLHPRNKRARLSRRPCAVGHKKGRYRSPRGSVDRATYPPKRATSNHLITPLRNIRP